MPKKTLRCLDEKFQSWRRTTSSSLKGRGFSFVLVAALSLWSFGTCADPVYNPVDGMVPDEATAIRIAEAVWIPLYGEEQVLLEEPYMGTLEGNVWKVESVSPHAISLGTYSAQISKLDGRILSLSHGK